jgi:predicted DNA-binding transcriptional regulator AlpA
MPHPNKTGRRLVKLKDATRRLGVSPSTVWEWRRQGILPQTRDINGRSYFFSDEFDASLDDLPLSDLKKIDE